MPALFLALTLLAAPSPRDMQAPPTPVPCAYLDDPTDPDNDPPPVCWDGLAK